MSSLRAAVRTLPRFPGNAYNLSDVADFIGLPPPLSVKALIDRINGLPRSREFKQTIVTGAALGGEVSLTLEMDGNYRFSGFMNASGIPSFDFSITALVRSGSGGALVAAQHSGSVFGTDTPGPRKHSWDIRGTDPARMALIRNTWPDVLAGTLEVRRSSELSGVLGTAVDLAKTVAELLIVAETLGAGMAVCVFLTAELGDAGFGSPVPGLGGNLGILMVGGGILIWGPLAVGPAVLLTLTAGVIIDAVLKVRPLNRAEIDLARTVFGDSLNFDKIRLTNLLGVGNAPFTMPSLDNRIYINIGEPAIDAADRIRINRYPFPGQLLIHELTHAWQIQHATLGNGFVPGWVCRGIEEQEIKGKKAAYNVGEAGADWHSFGVEAQATIVDEWYAGRRSRDRNAVPKVPDRPMRDENSPYFRYISDNIRLGDGGF